MENLWPLDMNCLLFECTLVKARFLTYASLPMWRITGIRLMRIGQTLMELEVAVGVVELPSL